jgi:hypothetical protein
LSGGNGVGLGLAVVLGVALALVLTLCVPDGGLDVTGFPVAICARSAIESPGAGAMPSCLCSGVVQNPLEDVGGLGGTMDGCGDPAAAVVTCLGFLP